MNTLNLRLLNGVHYEYPLWHPYSNANSGYQDHLNIISGKGVYLYDIHNHKYLDASSGLWNVSLGYSNAKIKQSIMEQLENLPYCSLFEHTNQTAILAANKVLSVADSYFRKVMFTCSGSESIELSVKFMRKYWKSQGFDKKNKILTLENSYHGTYYASLTASDIESEFISEYEPLVPGFYAIKPSVEADVHTKKSSLDILKETEVFIQKHRNEIAGILIEPILASNGVSILKKDYIEGLCRICQKYEILVTIDEIATGFYRTGKIFYYKNFDIKPDFVCISKGMNSGYLPMGGLLISEKIVNVFQSTGENIIHGSTQNGNLLSCASVIATIDQYEEMNISQNVNEMSKYFMDRLTSEIMDHENVASVHGEGFMVEIEMMNVKQHLPVSDIIKIQRQLQQEHVIVYRSETGLTILPMLIVKKDDLDFLVDQIKYVFSYSLL